MCGAASTLTKEELVGLLKPSIRKMLTLQELAVLLKPWLRNILRIQQFVRSLKFSVHNHS